MNILYGAIGVILVLLGLKYKSNSDVSKILELFKRTQPKDENKEEEIRNKTIIDQETEKLNNLKEATIDENAAAKDVEDYWNKPNKR